MCQREGLRADSSHFTLDGVPIRIQGGSIHYFRVPRSYWRDRLLKLKACGLNTLATYVPWNLHEPMKGVYRFEEHLDLEEYIRLAAELDLWVILRPGPYICAELDLGGLPSWLLRDKNMKLRTTYPGFTAAVNSYFDKLIPRVTPLQFSRGGPIIAMQVENEYGSYAKDEQYLTFIKEALLSRGVTELLLTSDNRAGLKCGGVEGVLQAINLQKLSYGAMQYLADMQPQKPLLVMEYWCGWFDVWGKPHHVFSAQDMIAEVKELLDRGISFNLYMFHGGSSFGFTNGAVDLGSYRPQVNSYDYDAPLTESGDYTTKYNLLRDVLGNYQNRELLQLPAVQGRKVYEPVVLSQHMSLWESIRCTDMPFRSNDPVNMENLPVNYNSGQSYGYTLYETTIYRGGALNSRNHVRDKALVFIDKHFIGILDYRTQEIAVPHSERERILGLLVENCGRVNFGPVLDEQRKGLVGDITLNHTPLKRFTMYSLELTPNFINRKVHFHIQIFCNIFCIGLAGSKPVFPEVFKRQSDSDWPAQRYLCQDARVEQRSSLCEWAKPWPPLVYWSSKHPLSPCFMVEEWR
ncbi:beta-galactosidase-1-like protein 2 isoform X3 [Brachyhypopomus gauderio]|uniref:beta-galactosidase-1-like protein 2 isoform X3 n=1 Tax=Brachyhypopomus gauderio TaxID=698409 RepID=UPI004043667D